MSVYGYCPRCGAPGKYRERRLDGDDTCENGHKYKSTNSRVTPKMALDNIVVRVSDTGQKGEWSKTVYTDMTLDEIEEKFKESDNIVSRLLTVIKQLLEE